VGGDWKLQEQAWWMMNVCELIKFHKFADNDFRAAAIATGCKLWECKTEDDKIARVRLYRDWRNSKIYGKLTAPCFEAACNGEQLPKCEHNSSIVLESIGAVDRLQYTWQCGKIYFTVREGIMTREVSEEEALGLMPAPTERDDAARYYGQADAV
jgi:hypothetical protein